MTQDILFTKVHMIQNLNHLYSSLLYKNVLNLNDNFVKHLLLKLFLRVLIRFFPSFKLIGLLVTTRD